MLRGKTESGFEFEIKEDALNDWKIIKYFRKVEKGEGQYIVDAAERLLGEEQCEKLEEFIEDKYGKLDAEIMSSEVASVLNAFKEGKNC